MGDRIGLGIIMFAMAGLSCGARTPLRVPDVPMDVLVDRDADVPERCNNGIDDDGDGLIDEGCPVCIRAGVSPWQIHRGEGVVCFGQTFFRNGDPREYDFANIPLETDPGWMAVARTTIDFSERSTVCDATCGCRSGGDFTYFQTVIALPDNFTVRSLVVALQRVDDGARITLFNARNPNGITPAGAFAFLPAGITANLESVLVPGLNRIVITHVDDCCVERSLSGVRVLLNDGELEQCR